MKLSALATVLLLLSVSALSQTATAPAARKSCDDLKAEIAKKLEAKGVTAYSLDAMDRGKESPDGKVIGTCDGGTKSLVYSRTAPAAEKTATETKPE